MFLDLRRNLILQGACYKIGARSPFLGIPSLAGFKPSAATSPHLSSPLFIYDLSGGEWRMEFANAMGFVRCKNSF